MSSDHLVLQEMTRSLGGGSDNINCGYKQYNCGHHYIIDTGCSMCTSDLSVVLPRFFIIFRIIAYNNINLIC